MIDEERIKLMARMASFEENEGKKVIRLTEYFQSDYVAFQMMKTAVSATAAWLLIVGVRLLCQFDTMIAQFYETDFAGMAKGFLREYLIILIGYVLFSYFLYTSRYTKAKKEVKVYQKALKRLSVMNGTGETENTGIAPGRNKSAQRERK